MDVKTSAVQAPIQQIPLWILPILAAVIFHEVAHGYVANWCGDDTAKRAGRLTLNPLPHIDPMGTIVIPLLLVVFDTGFLFGWAKPVPVNVSALRRPRRDGMLVAAAGPVTNLVLAVASALALQGVISIATGLGPGLLVETVLYPTAVMAKQSVLANVFLGVFNLLPIPPLDGGRVLAGLLPVGMAQQLARIEPFGFVILILLMSTHWLGAILHRPVVALLRVLLG